MTRIAACVALAVALCGCGGVQTRGDAGPPLDDVPAGAPHARIHLRIFGGVHDGEANQYWQGLNVTVDGKLATTRLTWRSETDFPPRTMPTKVYRVPPGRRAFRAWIEKYFNVGGVCGLSGRCWSEVGKAVAWSADLPAGSDVIIALRVRPLGLRVYDAKSVELEHLEFEAQWKEFEAQWKALLEEDRKNRERLKIK